MTEKLQTPETPVVVETSKRVKKLIDKLYEEKHIDEMTRRWLSLTPNPPRIPQFYTLTKIHKPTPVGRPIISGCEGPTERISSSAYGKNFVGGGGGGALNIIWPNETCWSQMHKMILS